MPTPGSAKATADRRLARSDPQPTGAGNRGGLAALARGLLRVTRLAGLAQRLFAAAMPETEAWLQRAAEARSYAMFLATAIALGAMFVAGTLAG